MKKGKIQTWVLVLGMALVIGASMAVSVPTKVSAVLPPDGVITAIDVKTGIVTAKITATGETLEFKLGHTAQIRNIKIGDPVSTDFQTGAVTVHSFQPVDGILIKAPMHPPPIK